MSAALALVLWHLAGAAAMAGVGAAPWARWANVALAAAGLPLALLVGPGGEGAWLSADALARLLAPLAALVGLTCAVYSAATLDAERFDAARARLYHACFQAFLGANHAALLADNLALMWVAVEAATIASVLVVAIHRTPAAIEAAWKFFVLCGVGIALALFGTLLLAAGDAGGAERLSFAALRALGAELNAGLVSLGFLFLLAGYGTKAGLVPLHAWMPDAHAEGPVAISAVLSGLLLNTAMAAVLRAKVLADGVEAPVPPGVLLAALGLASVLLASVALWRRRDARRLFAWSSIEQMGLAAVAFGIGAPVAGLLQMAGNALLKSAVFFAVGQAAILRGSQRMRDISGLVAARPALGWGLALAIAGVAGLPPFAVFLAEMALLFEAASRAPLLALAVGASLVAAGAALLRAALRLCFGPARAEFAAPVPRTVIGVLWLHIAMAALCGVFAPDAAAALFASAAEVVR
ncbi:MAG: hydrogenase 4 subunit F [Acetobacteraceae bacterium]|nr:hydrogenase 4 subunit F [Acetobacteraceae bacterium]